MCHNETHAGEEVPYPGSPRCPCSRGQQDEAVIADKRQQRLQKNEAGERLQGVAEGEAENGAKDERRCNPVIAPHTGDG